MFRPHRQPRPEAERGEPPDHKPNRPVRKWKPVEVACTRCHPPTAKRGGERPGLGACRQHRTEGEYDDDDAADTTPHANLRREYRHLVGKVEGYLQLLELLRTRPKEEATLILQRLRGNRSAHAVLGLNKEGRLLLDGSSFPIHQEVESAHTSLLGRRNSC